jgi:hypothetical protein
MFGKQIVNEPMLGSVYGLLLSILFVRPTGFCGNGVERTRI